MNKSRRLVSFDWALKRLLRSKANFEVLEGFLSELLHDDITIIEVLESESNQETKDDKFNRVDLKVRNQRNELIIIEVQYGTELDYLQRILYGTSKVIAEHIKETQPYSSVIKVISVNLLYFNLGQDKDYVYHGRTNFIGIHRKDQLHLSAEQQSKFSKTEPFEFFPEYYLIKINQFGDVARDPLDEWIYLFKNGDIKQNFTARGLNKAKKVLDVLSLSPPKRREYERHQIALHDKASFELTSYVYGEAKGKAEGLAEGEAKGEIKGRILTLKRQLTRRFGQLPDWAIAKIESANIAQLEVWAEGIFDMKSVDELIV